MIRVLSKTYKRRSNIGVSVQVALVDCVLVCLLVLSILCHSSDSQKLLFNSRFKLSRFNLNYNVHCTYIRFQWQHHGTTSKVRYAWAFHPAGGCKHMFVEVIFDQIDGFFFFDIYTSSVEPVALLWPLKAGLQSPQCGFPRL